MNKLPVKERFITVIYLSLRKLIKVSSILYLLILIYFTNILILLVVLRLLKVFHYINFQSFVALK